MGTPGRIQEVVSSLKERQQLVYRKDVSRSAIPKLNSPVVLVSTDLTCSHTLCERTYGFFIRKPKKKEFILTKQNYRLGTMSLLLVWKERMQPWKNLISM
jgi:hypothetical protein